LIISSPLQRARETAEILAESLDYPLVFDPLWMERNNGLLAGLSHTEASIRYPRPEFINPYHHIAQTGESQWELYLRAGQAIQSLIDRSSGRYLIVSHGGILNMVCYVILGLTPQANFQGPWFRFRNTAFTTLTYSPDIHEWSVWGVNDRLHWSEED
jgi:2,3-bisphosphoglycerate-dependent phosphoglycerate mutase